MVRLFSDAALARDLGERGPRQASQFSWDRTGRAVQSVLRQVLAGAA
jgi:hypothetical protein